MTKTVIDAQALAPEQMDDVDADPLAVEEHWSYRPTTGKNKRRAPARRFLRPEYVLDAALARELANRASAIATAQTSIGSFGLLVGGSIAGGVAGGFVTAYAASFMGTGKDNALPWLIAFVLVVGGAAFAARGYLLQAPTWMARANAYDRRAAHLDAVSQGISPSGDGNGGKPLTSLGKPVGLFFGFLS